MSDRSLRRRFGIHEQRSGDADRLPAWLTMPRFAEVEQVVGALCARGRGRHPAVAIVAAGPYRETPLGRLMIAHLVCGHRRVRRRFGDRIWWPAGADQPDEPGQRAAVLRRNARLAGRAFGFDDERRPPHEDRTLGMYRRLLLVLDGVQPGPSTVHGLLSRRPGHANLLLAGPGATLPYGTAAVTVSATSAAGHLRAQIAKRAAALPAGGADRLAELTVFRGSAPIPVSLVHGLWAAAADIAPQEARVLLRAMAELDLLRPAADATVAVHPVIRAAGRFQLTGPRVDGTTEALLEVLTAAVPGAEPRPGFEPGAEPGSEPRSEPGTDGGPVWWSPELDPAAAGYLREHLVAHLLAAGRLREAGSVAGDLRWITHRLVHDGLLAPYEDLIAAARAVGDLAARRDAYAAVVGVLEQTDPPPAVADILVDELRHRPAWSDQATALQTATVRAGRTVLAGREPRVPAGGPRPGARAHVATADLSPDGRWLATAGGPTITCEDLSTGATVLLAGRDRETVSGLRFGPDGTWLAALSHDARGGRGVEDPPFGTFLRLWNIPAGDKRLDLQAGRHGRHFTAFEIAADGAWIRVRGDRVVRAWDLRTLRELPDVPDGPVSPPRAEATSPDGAWRAEIHGGELRLWDVAGARPGPMTRINDTGTVLSPGSGFRWLPDGGLIAYGDGGRRRYDIRPGRRAEQPATRPEQPATEPDDPAAGPTTR